MIGSIVMIGVEQMAFVFALCGLLKDEIMSNLKYKAALIFLEVAVLLVHTICGLTGLWMILPNVLFVCAIKFIYRKSWGRSMMAYMMTFIIVCSVEFFYYIPFALAWGKLIENGLAGCIGSIGTAVTLFALVNFKVVDFSIIFEALFKRNVAMCFTLVTYSVIMLVSTTYFKQYQTISYYGYFFIVALFVMLLPILILYVKSQWELEEKGKYQKPILDVIDHIRQQQHQYDNHLNAIYGMIRAYDNYDELVEHLEDYMKNAGKADLCYQLLFIDDPVLSGFLSVKFADARERGIQVENRIEIKSVNTNIPIFELIGVLGNLFDNAFEETEKYPPERRCVKLYVGEKAESYLFRITNPSRNMTVSDMRSIFKKGYTTKDGSGKRGYGLYSVMKTINKYKGQIFAETFESEKEGYFFEIQLQIKKT